MGDEQEGTAPREGKGSGPFSFETVLHDELDFIEATRRHRGETEGVEPRKNGEQGDGHYQRALDSNLAGLAFSGGGIRSATFNLGVLQALAELGLLKRFDYLSTVSGGGYIGSWLTALIHRTFGSLKGRQNPSEEENGAAEVIASACTLQEVERRLRTDREDRVEDDAITFLRRFSNYLTPKVGLFSADAWTVGTTYFRNLILNLVVLVSAFGLALLAPRLLGWLLRELSDVPGWIWLALAGLALLLAVMEVGVHFGSFTVRNGQRRRRLTQGRVQKRIVLPFLVGSLLFTVWLTLGAQLTFPAFLGFLKGVPLVWKWTLFGVGIYGGGWLLGALRSGVRYRWDAREAMEVEWWRLIVCAALAGVLGGLGLWALQAFLTEQGETTVWRALTWGPPALLALFVLVGFFQTGFAGREIHDHQREWLSRLGAWMLIYAAGWLLLLLASTAGTAIFFWFGGWIATAAATGWLGATLAGLLAGRGTERPDVKVGKTRAFIAKAAPYVFIAGLVLLLAVGLDRGLSRIGGLTGWEKLQDMRAELADARADLDAEEREIREAAEASVENHGFGKFLEAQHALMQEAGPWELWGSTGVLLFLFFLFGLRVDINEFSMHRLYRNRLVRAYLGASVDPGERSERVQPFTGFSLDDILITDLAPTTPDDPGSTRYAAPLHLINTTLNLVGGEELAWQERKGASFVLSPLYSGFRTAEDQGASSGGRFGYRRSHGYGSVPKKLTLGSAFTISGAAASPNMGFRSSPALAFLLTVFNVRLGWWLGNPSHPGTWRSSGPMFGPLHLLYEVFGLTSDRNKYVYLSDGGHFENLGIYELVKRRCRFIVASDAGADPEMEFQDLGNAIRKCRTDLGIEIDLRPVALRPSEDTRLSTWHCAVGTLHYDDRHPGQGKGTLLYLKTSMTGDEPEDVRNYRRQNPEFPHQSTGDQFFDESQFESYRELGHHVASSALEEAVTASRRRALEGVQSSHGFRIEQLAHRLRQRWYPPSPATAKSFTRLTATMDELFDRARRNPDLDFLDEQFYPEWQSLLTGDPATEPPSWLPGEHEEGKEGKEENKEKDAKRRAGFYFCNELIQLMESVYLDLDLEHEHDHPDNRGWMNLFKHWSWSGMFRLTWAIACSTYGKRFVDFCEQKLGLAPYDELKCERFPRDKKGASLKTSLAKDKPLNFVELDILERFQQQNQSKGSIEIDHVYVFTLAVGDPSVLRPAEDDPSIRFRCGFAALDKERRIVLFRIQDHLRKLGLAREALRKLLDKKDGDLVRGLVPLATENIPKEYRAEFSERHRTRFTALFRSVSQELGRDGQGAVTPTGPVTPTE